MGSPIHSPDSSVGDPKVVSVVGIPFSAEMPCDFMDEVCVCRTCSGVQEGFQCPTIIITIIQIA